MFQEERQEEGSWVMAALIAMRAWAWVCTTAMSWSKEEEVVGEGAGATTSAAIAEFMMMVRIERRWRMHGRFSIDRITGIGRIVETVLH